ncbi:MAG TPA: TonB-dependent receptor [Bacteroidia bacterium]|nr:TonB-dependent receptor [Bacteroidia bacterium]
MSLYRYALLLIQIVLCASAAAQNSSLLTGTIYDQQNNERISGATIFSAKDHTIATASDANGNYTLPLTEGSHIILCSFVGMESDTAFIIIKALQNTSHNFHLRGKEKMLETVVISASKFEQKISELTVSMEVIRPSLIESRNTTNITEVLDQVPGLTILDGEPQIRSGSGFSFGVGSRVGILIDGIPALIGDQGRPEWSFLPLENVEQIEVIKGASSVLYGSSSLSGVINVRTTYPKEKALTKVQTHYGQYDSPSISGSKWWDGAAPIYGFSFLHSERIGKKDNIDLVIGGRALQDHNFIGPPLKVKFLNIPVDTTLKDKDVATRLGRINFGLRFRPESIKGLSLGINGNFMQSHDNFSLVWLNDSSGLYRALPGTMTISNTKMFYLDPYITYFSHSGIKHTLSLRYFHNDVDNSNNQSNSSDVYYGEYQAYKEFQRLKGLKITGGLVMNLIKANSELYTYSEKTKCSLDNYAAFIQADKTFLRTVNLSAGYRVEYFTINDSESVVKPIARGGVSWALTKGTFLRYSYGQGYRYPSITEKYIFTSAGGLYVFPNPELKAESSSNMEVGLKQGFKMGSFLGYLDIAFFRQKYENTIEYTYARWIPDSAGFKFVNTGTSFVKGYEISLAGGGKIFRDLSINILAGYTYTLPQSDGPDYVYGEDNPGPGFFSTKLSYNTTSTDTSNRILKYRFRHTAKADLEISWKYISLGFSAKIFSFMENIDKLFYDLDVPSILPSGIKKYREENSGATVIYDARIRIQFTKIFSVSILSNNLTNTSYSLRPLKIEAPRTISMQLTAKF